MKVFLLLFISLSCATRAPAQYKTAVKRIYSTIIKDSFEIYTSVPGDYSAMTKYDVTYYCDASLRSGKKLRELIETNKQPNKQANNIFVGIGHIGNYHILRRRDFVLPVIHKNDTTPKSGEYGHIQDFYSFLLREVIPSIQSLFHCTDKRTIIGHSLGGLFVLYCLFQNERIFSNYIALSPALWIDHYRLYEFNKLRDSLAIKSYLYLSAGSRETFNRILTGANQMNEFLKTKNYTDLKFEYEVHPGKSHNSQVPVSLKYILQKI